MFKSKIFSKLEISIALGMIFTILLSCISFGAECRSIRNDVLRLHILANSDSQIDQRLKLKVRDEILKMSDGIFENCRNIDTATASAKNNIESIRQTALKTLRENGCDMPVSAEVAPSYFNTRHYDTVTLPAGMYNAVKIKIGKAEGHNWWCMMYPSLCLPAAADNYDIALDKNERDVVENYTKYEVKFKIVELIEQAFNGK